MTSAPHTWRRLLAGVALCGILLCAVGCQDTSGTEFHFQLPLSGEPRQLDPQVSADAPSVEIEMALFEGLTQLAQDGKVRPAAAADWTVSADGLTYTFFLRANTWSDGIPVTAADFVYGFQRAIDPATGSALATKLSGIAGATSILNGKKSVSSLGVVAADDSTLVITLTQPDDTFLAQLAAPPFFPCRQDFFVSCRGRYGLEPDYVLGNGPFILSKWNHGSSLLLSRNERYAAVSTISPTSVRYRMDITTEGLTALRNETLDVARLTTGEEIVAARRDGMTVTALADTLYALWFNCEYSVLQQAAVRTALRDAVAWDTVRSHLDAARYTAATGYITPCSTLADGTPYRRPENAQTYTPNHLAETQLKQALGDTACPSLTLLCAEEDLLLAQDIVQSWQKNLRVYFRLETVSKEQLETRLKAGNYEMALGTVTAPDAEVLSALSEFGEKNITENYARFSDVTFEKALATAQAQPSRAHLEQAEQVLSAACPCVPIAFEHTCYGISSRVSQLTVHAFSGGLFGSRFFYRSAQKEPN